MSGYCGDCGHTMCQCYKHKKEHVELGEPDSLKGSFLDAITTLKAELAEANKTIGRLKGKYEPKDRPRLCTCCKKLWNPKSDELHIVTDKKLGAPEPTNELIIKGDKTP